MSKGHLYVRSSCLSLLAFLLCVTNLFAAAGDLDQSFGTGGKVTTDLIGPNNDFIHDAAIQPDGKIILVGRTHLRDFSSRSFLVRLLPDGNFDPTFGSGGKVGPDPNGAKSSFYSVLILSDGKILTAGTIYNSSTREWDFLISRFNYDGSIDVSFGSNGIVTSNWDEDDYFVDLSIQPDGKIVAAGASGEFSFDGGYYYRYMIARYQSNGLIDTSFSRDGLAEAFECGGQNGASSMSIQSDGKILLTGTTECGSRKSGYNFGVVRFNADGTIDSSFGEDGQAIIDFSNNNDLGGGLIIQNDGKVLLGGTTYDLSDRAIRKIALIRLNSDGSMDLSFGSGGKLIFKIGKTAVGGGLALQPDGKIIVEASAGKDDDTRDFVLFRFNGDGTTDHSFGSDGIVKTDFAQERDEIHSLVLGVDGSILAAGASVSNGQFDAALARYDTGGNVDKNFGESGKVIFGFTSSLGEVLTSIKIQPDGKIVAAGNKGGYPINLPLITRYLPNGSLDSSFGENGATSDWHGEFDNLSDFLIKDSGEIITVGTGGGDQNPYCIFVAQYKSNGFLDQAFGSQGITCIDLDGYFQGLSSVAIQSDEKIVASGFVRKDFGDLFLTVRFNPDGTLDNSFGSDGIVTTMLLSDANHIASAVAIQSDGRIVVAGHLTENAIGTELVLLRYLANGSLDETFGNGGIVQTDLSSGVDVAYDMILQQDGKILVGGQIDDSLPDTGDFLLVRYLTDGGLDSTFGANGIVRTDISDQDYLSSLAIDSSNRIIAAGSAELNGDPKFAVARYNQDGSLDVSFGNSGKVTTSFNSRNYAYAVAVQSDQKIVVGGTTHNEDTLWDFALARYDSSDINLLPLTLPYAIPGNSYDQTITANGGVAPYTFMLINGSLPAGLAFSPNGNISGIPAEGGTYIFTIQATDSTGIAGSTTYSMLSVLLFDDFEDGVLNWNVTTRGWEEIGGSLIGDSGLAFAPIPWNPSGANGCSICSVEVNIQISSNLFSKVVLNGWYQDKNNVVELIMDERRNRWILQQRSSGSVVARKKVVSLIEPDTIYQIKLQYNGNEFQLWVDGTITISLSAGTNPFGNFGFRVRNTTARFSEIKVY